MPYKQLQNNKIIVCSSILTTWFLSKLRSSIKYKESKFETYNSVIPKAYNIDLASYGYPLYSVVTVIKQITKCY